MTIIIVATGESNSGGYGDNADASAGELASRSEVQMWNVNTSTFENLDIGTNNNLDHSGLASTSHGWELQLANDVASGVWSQNPMYYVQTGQGGTTIASWAEGGSPWTKFLARINAVKSYCSANSITPEWVIWVSLGINDALGTTNVTTFKTDFIAWLNRIKTECPSPKIVLNELPPSYTAYTTAIREIADSETDVTFVYTQDLTGGALRDDSHWSYSGLKTLSTRMTRTTQIGLGLRDGKWFSHYSANCFPNDRLFGWSGTSPGTSGATSKNAVAFADGAFVSWLTNTAASATLICLEATKDTSQSFSGAEQFLYGAYRFGSSVWGGVNYGGLASRGSVLDEARIYRSGNDALLQVRSTGGEWSTIHTATNAFSGVTQVWPKITNTSAATDESVTLSFQLAQSITVTAPTIGTIALVGVAQSVTWTSNDISGTVDILYSADGEAAFSVIASAETNDGSYSWTPTADQLSANGRIRVRSTSSQSVYGTSNAIKVATTEATGGGSNTAERQFLRQIAESILAVVE